MKIILSDTSRGAFNGVLELLKKRTASAGKHIVIVPDRFTAYIEREIMEYLSADSLFDVEVMSFTRLALKCLGRGARRCLTPEGSVMLLASVLQKNKDKLEYYNKAAASEGFASELYAAVTEIRNSGVTADALIEKSKDMPPYLAAKARDIAFVYGEYLKELVEKYTDSTTRLEALAQYIKNGSPNANGGLESENGSPNKTDGIDSAKGLTDASGAPNTNDNLDDVSGSPNAGGGNDGTSGSSNASGLNSAAQTAFGAPDAPEIATSHFYIADFAFFTAPEMDIISALSDKALSLCVGLIHGFDNPNARIYPSRTLKRLMNACSGRAETEIVRDSQNEVASTLSKWLFSYEKPKKRVENNGVISVFRARDRYDEVLRLALSILEKVRGGARYRDTEVFVSSLEAYSHEIKSVFSRYKIPFFIDEKQPLAEQTKIKYLLGAVAAVRSGFRAQEMTDFVKNPLFYNDPNFISSLKTAMRTNADFTLSANDKGGESGGYDVNGYYDKANLSSDADSLQACRAEAPDYVIGYNAVSAFENYSLKRNVNYSRFLKPFDGGSALKPLEYAISKPSADKPAGNASIGEAAAATDLDNSDNETAYFDAVCAEESSRYQLNDDISKSGAPNIATPKNADDCGKRTIEGNCGSISVKTTEGSADCFDGAPIEKTFDRRAKEDNAAFKEAMLAEAVRARAVELLSVFDFFGARGISDFTDGARQLLDNADGAWRIHIESLSEMSAYYSKCAEQVDEKILSVLDEMETVLSGETDVSGFETVLKSMLKSLQIALVPTYLDCVFVGGADSRFTGKGDVAVLGANSGVFPSYSGSGIVITQKDGELLSSLGIELLPDSSEKLGEGMLAVCEIMTKPRKKLEISFACESGEGELKMSSVLSEAAGLIYQNGKPLEINDVRFDNLADRKEDERKKICGLLFSTPEAAYHEILQNALSGRTRLSERGIYASAYAVLDRDKKRALDNAFDLPERINLPFEKGFGDSVSVSRLENFYACPYSHYFKYILSLKRRKEARFDGTENGVVVHAVLEKFLKPLIKRDVYGELEADKLEAAIKRDVYRYFAAAVAENDYGVFMEKPDTARILLRLRDESVQTALGVYALYKRSRFKPSLLEARFGKALKPPALEVNGKKIELRGVIDRVDMKDGRFIVIDYKTYKSADLSLKDVYFGRRIQLYVYMKALENALGVKSAGVFYLPVYPAYTEEGKTRFKYAGHALADEQTLNEIDCLFGTDAAASALPDKRDRKGGLSPDVFLSDGDFDLIGNYVGALAAKAALETERGYIKPSPSENYCSLCDFSSVCAFKNAAERKGGKVSVSSFSLVPTCGGNALREESENE
jgi:ATP-dependent helicase/DNAse subunit B